MDNGGFRRGRALRPEATLVRNIYRIPSTKRQRCDPPLIAAFFGQAARSHPPPLGIMIRTSSHIKNRLIKATLGLVRGKAL